jgi:hypothetical protein
MSNEEVEIREIFNRYRKAIHIQKMMDEGYMGLLETHDEDTIKDFKNHQSRVEMTIKMLKPISKIFINNCYVKRNDDAWWFSIYSRSTFYRLKKEAIHEFMYYFNI